MNKGKIYQSLFLIFLLFQGFAVYAQEAHARWETMNLIRKEKLDIILPKAMRDNKIDMWITMVKFGRPDPLSEDLGGGSPHDWYSKGRFLGYYVFTDRGGDRIERAALGVKPRDRSVYDIFIPAEDLKKFVTERNPLRIAVNISEYVGVADGLSYTCYLDLVKTLGSKYAERLVSAEKLICDFRSQRVTSEIVLFGKAAELSRQIMERALSNAVITPGVTTLGDVGWWIADQILALGHKPFPGFPRVIYPIPFSSPDYIIQPGDLVALHWKSEIMNFHCDLKRIGYVLPQGHTDVPPAIKDAFRQGLKALRLIRKHVKPGQTGIKTLEFLYRKLEEAGYEICHVEDQVSDSRNTEINIGWHSAGNGKHGVGPAIWTEKPFRREHELKPSHLMAFEYFIYYPLAEWDGKKLRLGFKEKVIITENGVDWLHPPIEKINIIR